MHGGLKKGLGSMGSSMRNLGGSMSPPKMPSFKRPSSPFGRKSPAPVEEPSEEPEVNERTVVFSPEPEAAPEPEPAAPEPAAPEPEAAAPQQPSVPEGVPAAVLPLVVASSHNISKALPLWSHLANYDIINTDYYTALSP